MNKLSKKMKNSKIPTIKISKRLEKYDSMPLFQDKVDKANAFLATFPIAEFIREQKHIDIKLCFEKGHSTEETAKKLNLSVDEVISCLKEMGLIEKVEA
jgi:predicted transcriptional regulator